MHFLRQPPLAPYLRRGIASGIWFHPELTLEKSVRAQCASSAGAENDSSSAAHPPCGPRFTECWSSARVSRGKHASGQRLALAKDAGRYLHAVWERHFSKDFGVEQTIANYTLVRLLGRGGMGSVYEARQTAIERRVAIKVLHKEFCEDTEVLKRFINEARVVNIIGHPGLVGVSEFGQTNEGAPFIVMEYVEGITLREWLQRQAGRIPVEKVVRLSRQLASTLAAAHAKQIVHRDLKPVNIMLCADEASGELERVKILDFGIAKLGTENTSQTKSGVLMGTDQAFSISRRDRLSGSGRYLIRDQMGRPGNRAIGYELCDTGG